jgi:hypothetical protein
VGGTKNLNSGMNDVSMQFKYEGSAFPSLNVKPTNTTKPLIAQESITKKKNEKIKNSSDTSEFPSLPIIDSSDKKSQSSSRIKSNKPKYNVVLMSSEKAHYVPKGSVVGGKNSEGKENKVSDEKKMGRKKKDKKNEEVVVEENKLIKIKKKKEEEDEKIETHVEKQIISEENSDSTQKKENNLPVNSAQQQKLEEKTVLDISSLLSLQSPLSLSSSSSSFFLSPPSSSSSSS